MGTLIFSLVPDKKLQGTIDSLKQSMIDQTKTFESNYEGLSHIRSLYVEELVVRNHKVVLGLSPEYFMDLRTMNELHSIDEPGVYLASMFIQPKESLSHLNLVADLFQKLGTGQHNEVRKKHEFLKKQSKKGETVFEITDPTIGCSFEAAGRTNVKLTFKNIPAAEPMDQKDDVTPTKSAISRAISRAHKGHIEPVSLDLSPYSHIAITEGLRHFLYKRPGKSRVDLPIGYTDGSEAAPFPMLALEVPTDKDLADLRKIEPLPIGMITNRHPEMDKLLGGYVFRNLMISDSRPLAITDEIAYQETKVWLQHLAAEGPQRIAFYQTGNQPTLIGFYRAIVEELIESRARKRFWLEIIPHFFQKKSTSYTAGEPWS